MKNLKLLILLYFSVLFLPTYAQVSTGQEQEFDTGIKNNASQTVTTPVYLVTQGTDGTQGKIDPSMLAGENRVAVNDVSYIILGTGNKIIAYTVITADRTVTLPPANTPNQRIWITDESGLCSNSRRIIVQPSGSDVIGGDAFSVINFPNGSGYLESNGAGKWNIISTTAVQFSAGVNTLPTITDNGNGSVTLGTGVYSLFANANGVGRPKAYQIAGSTFTFVDGSTNYIYADYNTATGAVTLQQTTTETPLNDLTQTLVYAAYRQGTTLHPRNFDTQGIALSNKINRSIYRTQRVRFEEGGILVGESASPAVRTITISAGTVWVAATEQPLSALTSAANTCYHVIQTSPGVWTTSTIVTQYNNTQYNTTAGLQTLNNNEYGVNWLYRSIGTDNDMAIILGGASYTLGQAQSSQKPTNLPPFMRHMELVGRIIVLKNATTATQIDNVSSTFFTASGVTDHNALNNLQTAQTGVTYGHITDGAQTIAGVKSMINTGATQINGLNLTNNGTFGSTSLLISNASTGSGIALTNYSSGKGIELTLTGGSSGQGIGISNAGTGEGINISNFGTGTGLYIGYSGTGSTQGLLLSNSSTNSASKGIFSGSTSAGTSIYSSISGSGSSIVSNVGTSGTGFAYVGQNNSVNTFTVDKLGTVTGTSFIKSGATASNILLAGGTDIPQSTFALASGSGNYIQNQTASAQTANMWISGNVRASSAVISGDISGTGATALKTIWGGAYGGAIQLKTDGITTDRYSRLGIIDGSGTWLGGLQISNDLTGVFSTSVAATTYQLRNSGGNGTLQKVMDYTSVTSNTSSLNLYSQFGNGVSVLGLTITGTANPNVIVPYNFTAGGIVESGFLRTTSPVLDAAPVGEFAMFTSGDGVIRKSSPAVVKSLLGLGSNAYNSTAYLPLTGGTLSGSLGIGVSPIAKLHVDVTSSTGAAGADGVRVASGLMGLNLGTESTSNYSWIQSALGGSGARTLSLNPHGGNVGIGTTNPGTSPNNTTLGFLNGSNIQARTGVPQLVLSSNIDGDWYNATYKNNGYAGQISIDPANMGNGANGISFNVAPSGTAGNPITWQRAMTIIANGNVGIGTTNPITRLNVDKPSQSIGATTPSGGFLLTDNVNTSYSLEAGINVGYGPWIQSRSYAAATMYQLAINPSGGNVLIGTTTDTGNKLRVVGGSVRFDDLSGTGTRTVVADASGNLSATTTPPARPYLVYTAILSQSGTSAPTATVLENTLGGTVVYSYDAVGQYRGTLTGAFPTAKTFFTHGGGAATLNTQIRTNANTNYFTIITNTGSTAADTVLQNTCVEIRVYP